jgi:hypothetical protein
MTTSAAVAPQRGRLLAFLARSPCATPRHRSGGWRACAWAAWMLKTLPATGPRQFGPLCNPDADATTLEDAPAISSLPMGPGGVLPNQGGTRRLFLRRLDQLSTAEMPGTEDGHAPFFSPAANRLPSRRSIS